MTVKSKHYLPVGEQRQLCSANLVQSMKESREYAIQVVEQDFSVDPAIVAELDVMVRDLVELVATIRINALEDGPIRPSGRLKPRQCGPELR